jgi:hypothetical protein
MGLGNAKKPKAPSFEVMGLLTQQHAMDRIEISRKSNRLRARRPGGFGFLHPPGQGQNYRRFQAWQGSDCRDPGARRILRRGSADWDTAAVGNNHHNVDMRDHTARV